MTEKESFDFLWNCARCLSSQTHTERLLKSYYTTTCRKLAKKNVQLPTENFGSGRMCARCGIQWYDGNYQLRLKSATVSETQKRLQQVFKLDELQWRGQETPTLSRGARKRAKWLKKRMASNVDVHCSLCGHKTMLALEKPKRKQTKVQAKPVTMEPKGAATLLKNHKQKKAQKHNHLGPVAATAAKTPAAAKKHKAKPKSTPPTPPPPSKTQKKNALLQLAAQLKASALKGSGKTQQNRLQSLLK